MTTRANYIRAVQLDDDAPDNRCPACGQWIDGWENHEAHYPPDRDPSYSQTYNRTVGTVSAPWPFTDSPTDDDVCPWTRDYLAARAVRRRLIAEGVTT